MRNFTVIFLPANSKISVPCSKTLLQAARECKLAVDAHCGGRGLCGGCAVRIVEPKDPPLLDEDRCYLSREQLKEGFRLACRHKVDRDLTVRLPRAEEIPSAKLSILELESSEIKPQGAPRKILFTPPRSSLRELNIHLEKALLEVLPPGRPPVLPLEIISRFSGLLGSGQYPVTLIAEEDRLIGVEPGDTSDRILGAAVDIGTTTIALYLCDLESGRMLAASAMTNSQSSYGADVMSRIGFSLENPEGLSILSRTVRRDLKGLAEEACLRVSASPELIYRWVLVGNTTMQHLFLGIDPSPLGRSPYLPLVNSAVRFSPGELGLPSSPFASGVFLPTVAGHVGADTVAVALAARLDQARKLTLAIDLGTNGEIVLAQGGRMLCCSTAAGPAFEGARIQMGMRAETGAVDRFRINIKGEVELHVIGEDVRPRGICGSGLVEIAAELLRWGVIDRSGRILPPEELAGNTALILSRRIKPGEFGQYSFMVSEGSDEAVPVILTQRDIRELQLAVGAISSGIKVLLKLAGFSAEDIETVLMTGAFGHYLDPSCAVAAGIIRGVNLDRIRSIGNAAGLGARDALISAEEMEKAIEIASRMEFVELATNPHWQEEFTESMFFPEPERPVR